MALRNWRFVWNRFQTLCRSDQRVKRKHSPDPSLDFYARHQQARLEMTI